MQQEDEIHHHLYTGDARDSTSFASPSRKVRSSRVGPVSSKIPKDLPPLMLID